MARAVMGIPVGDPREVDHREVLKTLDNREGNLRVATRSQNNANRRLFKNNTTGYRGVYLDKRTGTFYVRCQVGGVVRHLARGLKTAAEGSCIFSEEKLNNFGEFARID